MQIVSLGENMHEMLKPIFWENNKNIDLSSSDLAQRVVMVKDYSILYSTTIRLRVQY